jgi:hypothetical protein
VELPVKTVAPGLHPILSNRALSLLTSSSKGCCWAKLELKELRKIRARKIDFFINQTY